MTVYFHSFFFEEKDIELAARVQIALIFRSRDAKFTEQFSLSTYAVSVAFVNEKRVRVVHHSRRKIAEKENAHARVLQFRPF